MKSFKYLVVAMTLMVFASVQGAFAAPIQISGQAPQFDDLAFQAIVDAAFLDLTNSIETELGNFDSNPKKLGRAFANAGSYSNHAATQRAYQGYDLFAITVGTMAGGQLPSMDFSTYGDLGDRIKDEGDIEAGIGWQAWALQVGINSKFLLDGLYLGLKFGYLSFDVPVGDNKAKFDFLAIGAMANYQIFKERSLTGMLVWRGLSVGSGLMYQKLASGFLYDIGEVSGTDSGVIITGSPVVSALLDSNLCTIPVEVNTSIRLLYVLNLSVGLGFDINFGSSSMIIGADSDLSVSNVPGGVNQTSAGYLSTDAGVKNARPKAFAAKAMANIGIGIGPVILDIPFTYYFNNGFNLGLSVGFVW